jgi:SAM-dependent methyltransferase
MEGACYPRIISHKAGASERLRTEARHYIPSQFLAAAPLGGNVKGFRNENLEKLTFLGGSIDLHVTQDVFEHILDPAAAFREIARTLRDGGAQVFTTPLVGRENPTEFCAKRRPDGTIMYLKHPPEYHGSPMSAQGSLVTAHWGYDITKYIFEASGLFIEIIFLDLLDCGIRAEHIEVLITRKSPRKIAPPRGSNDFT